MTNIRKTVALVLFGVMALGCGRYLRPIPPEAVAPDAVGGLGVSANDVGVNISWTAPKLDRRGEELYRAGTFRVERKALDRYTGLLDLKKGFAVLSEIEDKSVVERVRLEEEALAAGRPVSRVKVDATLTKFLYTDKDVQFGKQYIYRVVPANPSGDGAVVQAFRVLFRGVASEVSPVTLEKDDQDLMDDPFA